MNTVFANAIDSLSEDDKDLPQVGAKSFFLAEKGRMDSPMLSIHFWVLG